MDIKIILSVIVGISAFSGFTQNVFAQDAHAVDISKLFIPAVYPINDWRQQDYDFTKPAPSLPISPPDSNISQTINDNVAIDKNKASFNSNEDDFIERLMKKIPYSKSLKYTWKVVDGDVDLYFEDLRFDRGNKGVSYKIDTLPMIGKIHGTELKAEVGEDNKLTFKSDYMPLVGRIDGFQLKASTTADDSNISLRYKTDISW